MIDYKGQRLSLRHLLIFLHCHPAPGHISHYMNMLPDRFDGMTSGMFAKEMREAHAVLASTGYVTRHTIKHVKGYQFKPTQRAFDFYNTYNKEA